MRFLQGSALSGDITLRTINASGNLYGLGYSLDNIKTNQLKYIGDGMIMFGIGHLPFPGFTPFGFKDLYKGIKGIYSGIKGLKNLFKAKEGAKIFEIADGVRRAKAAEQLGHTSIEAMDHTGKVFQVPIESLRSPFKNSIDISSPLKLTRYDRIYNGLLNGDKLPPIYVNPGNNGTSIFDIYFIN